MHNRKGSLGVWPSRPRASARLSGLLLLTFFSLLVIYYSKSSFYILPYSRPFAGQTSCPATAPYPSLVASPSGKFDWENVSQHYPVDGFVQLPIRDKKQFPRMQHDFSKEQASVHDEEMRKSRQAIVKAQFERYWGARKTDDSLSLIDSLDTLWIMGMKDEVSEAILRITDLDFASQEIIHIPSMTRYLSALLSAYDLLQCADTRLLSKAMELGFMLYSAFDTPNRLPVIHWNVTKAKNGEPQEAAIRAAPADLTSLSLPLTRLSQLTGDMRYYDAVTRISTHLNQQQNSTAIPGLWPSTVNLQSSNLTSDNTFTADTTSGPTYAHLASMYQLLHNTTAAAQYLSMSTTATEAITQHLLFRPITPDNASILVPSSAYTTPTGSIVRTHSIAASSCSLGSTLALRSLLAPTTNTDDLYYPRLLTEGCIYNTLQPHSLSNPLMPESFTMLACTSASPSRSAENCTFNPVVWPPQEYPGFEKILDAKVALRSEAVESVWTMWRVTGEHEWMEKAWEMWVGVKRVLDEDVIDHDDKDENVMVMQTLKYFYLVFSEPDVLSLDDWVFGSHGHLFHSHV